MLITTPHLIKNSTMKEPFLCDRANPTMGKTEAEEAARSRCSSGGTQWISVFLAVRRETIASQSTCKTPKFSRHLFLLMTGWAILRCFPFQWFYTWFWKAFSKSNTLKKYSFKYKTQTACRIVYAISILCNDLSQNEYTHTASTQMKKQNKTSTQSLSCSQLQPPTPE